MAKNKIFHGIVLPTLTYYNPDKSIDYTSTLVNIEYVLNEGFTWDNSCLLVGGAGGDAVMLTMNERIELMEKVYRTVNGRVPVGASVQDTNVDYMVKMAVRAEEIGLDFIQVSPTYYYESSFEDFDRVMMEITSKTNNIAILVYNVPWENVIDLNSEHITFLVNKYPQFRGLKWGTDRGNDEYLKVINKFKSQLQIIDNQNMHVMTYLTGGVGHISHFANVYPKLAVKLYELLKSGEYKQAQDHIFKYNQIWREFRLYMWKRSALESPVVKTALEIKGRPGRADIIRLPSRKLMPMEKDKLKIIIDRMV